MRISAQTPSLARHGEWFAGAALFLAFFFLYHQNLNRLPGLAWWINNRIFYADTSDIYRDTKAFSLDRDMRKHPLFALTVAPAARAIHAVTGFSRRDSARVTFALLAALNVLIAFRCLRILLGEAPAAALAAALHGLLFAHLAFWSVPETASLASLALCLFWWMFLRFAPAPSPRRILLLGAVAGAGALATPPLGLLTLPAAWMAWRTLPRRAALRWIAAEGALALAIFLAVALALFGAGFFESSARYSETWASAANFLAPSRILNVFVSFFLYSAVSPLSELRAGLDLRHFSEYWRSPLPACAALAWLAALGGAIWTFARLLRQRRESSPDPAISVFAGAAIVWIAVIVPFYIYFNPREAFLYSGQALGAIYFLMAGALREWSALWRRAVPLALGALLGFVNLRCLYG